jgi:hypothetical protein
MLQAQLRRDQPEGACNRPIDQTDRTSENVEAREHPTATDVLIHSLLQTPVTPIRPRNLLIDPLQTPLSPASAPTQRTKQKQDTPHSCATCQSDPAAPRNASSLHERSPGVTWSAPTAHSNTRTPWNPAGISSGTFLRPQASPSAAPRKQDRYKVSPRYLNFMNNPRTVRGRRGSRPNSALQQAASHKCSGDLSPLPRVAFLSPPLRGQDLARTLGIRTKEEIEEDKELEVLHFRLNNAAFC